MEMAEVATVESIFQSGAETMRLEISMRLVVQGHIAIAAKVLTMPLPRFHITEIQSIE
jgi:hypothetical protein